jgi:hypothetical protein
MHHLEMLKERIEVCVHRASEVSMNVTFSVTVDNLMIDWEGDMMAMLSRVMPSMLSPFSDDVRRRLDRVARYTISDLADVESVVFRKLQYALDDYENWNFDEERERQAGRMNEEAA